MQRLRAWLGQQRRRQGRRVVLEESLLGGRFPRYAWARLRRFVVLRAVGVLAHAMELVLLWLLFHGSHLHASLLLQNGCLLVLAAWWGALEVLRVAVRRRESAPRRSELIGAWLRRAAAVACVPLTIAAGSVAYRLLQGELLGVVDAYAALCCGRLALDILVRTYTSGAYALRRIYRPMWSLLVPELAGLALTVVTCRALGAWGLPFGLAVTVLLSRGLTVFYAWKMYRTLRLPRPRIGRARRGVQAGTLRQILVAAAAGLAARLGPLLVFALLLQRPMDDADVAPELVALQLVSPLLTSAVLWAQLFYPDLKRLEGEPEAALRRRLLRKLSWLSLVVGATTWCLAIGAILGLIPAGHAVIPGLLPLFLGVSHLAALQMRDLALGSWTRAVGAGFVVVASLGASAWAVGTDRPAVVDASAEVGALKAAVAAVALGLGAWYVWRLRSPSEAPRGLKPGLRPWLRSLAAVRRPLLVGSARLEGGRGDQRLALAVALAETLRDRGAATLARHRLLWFEPADRASPITNAWLAGAACGNIAMVERGVHEAGGRAVAALVARGWVRPTTPDVRRGEGAPSRSAPAARTRVDLDRAFRACFPDGIVVDLRSRSVPAAVAKMPPWQRQALWRDSLRQARGGSVRRHCELESGVLLLGGELAVIYAWPAGPSAANPATRRAWRETLEAANMADIQLSFGEPQATSA